MGWILLIIIGLIIVSAGIWNLLHGRKKPARFKTASFKIRPKPVKPAKPNVGGLLNSKTTLKQKEPALSQSDINRIQKKGLRYIDEVEG